MNDESVKRAIEFCLAVYRITDRFPQEEPLRGKLRQISIDVVEFLVYNVSYPTVSGRFFNSEDLKQKLRNLFVHFDIAEEQEWVNKENFGVLKGEYRKLYSELALRSSKGGVKSVRKRREKTKDDGFNGRQKTILKSLEGRTEGCGMEELAAFMHTSKKTVERNMKELLVKKMVFKKGNTKGARFFSKSTVNY